jgi:hypothetical protein
VTVPQRNLKRSFTHIVAFFALGFEGGTCIGDMLKYWQVFVAVFRYQFRGKNQTPVCRNLFACEPSQWTHQCH